MSVFTVVHVNGHAIEVPNDMVRGFVRNIATKRLVAQAERSIAREQEIDELVELMNGHTV